MDSGMRVIFLRRHDCLTQPTSFTLTLQQGKDIILAHRTLDVPDDCPACIIHEFDANLRHTTTRASTTQDLDNFREFYGDFASRIHVDF